MYNYCGGIWFLVSYLQLDILGVYFSGFHGIPYPYMLPSVATAPYNNAMSYGPNGAGGKFQNNKVFLGWFRFAVAITHGNSRLWFNWHIDTVS